MIGKLLQEDETEKTPETEDSSLNSNQSADALNLPEAQAFNSQPSEEIFETPADRANRDDLNAFQNIENQENYALAAPDAIAAANNQTSQNNPLPAETTAENLRKTGLAWSAATVLGGSVVFMMILGWFFDLVFGSKPWGIVGGIVLGAIIGFIQFFRITSQIFKNDSNGATGILGDRDDN